MVANFATILFFYFYLLKINFLISPITRPKANIIKENTKLKESIAIKYALIKEIVSKKPK